MAEHGQVIDLLGEHGGVFIALGFLQLEDVLHHRALEIDHQGMLGEHVGHVGTLAHGAGHFLKAAGLLGQQDHAGHAVVLEALHSHGEASGLEGSLKKLCDLGGLQLLLVWTGQFDLAVFFEKVFGEVGVDPLELDVAVLGFQKLDEVAVDQCVEEQHFHPLALEQLDVGRLGGLIVSVVDLFVVLGRGPQQVFIEGGVLAVVGGAENDLLLHLVVELVVAEHAVLDEGVDVVPDLAKGLAVLTGQVADLACYATGDDFADLPYLRLVLQVRTGHIEGQIGGIEAALQRG